MANSLRNATLGAGTTPGTDRSLENMIARKGKKRKKNVFQHAGDRLSDAVDMTIRKRILGPSEVTGKF